MFDVELSRVRCRMCVPHWTESCISTLGDLLAGDASLRMGVSRDTMSALLDTKHKNSRELYGWASASAAVQLLRRVYH